MPGGKGGRCGTECSQSPQRQAPHVPARQPSGAGSTCPCPLTWVVLSLQPAAGQLQGQRGIGPLVLSLQAQGQRWPPFLQGFQRWTQVEGTLQRGVRGAAAASLDRRPFLMSSAPPSFPTSKSPALLLEPRVLRLGEQRPKRMKRLPSTSSHSLRSAQHAPSALPAAHPAGAR